MKKDFKWQWRRTKWVLRLHGIPVIKSEVYELMKAHWRRRKLNGGRCGEVYGLTLEALSNAFMAVEHI